MRFSIICTNYNKEPYIEKCITSVLEQNFTDYEFIIIDDASTDGSPAIIQAYYEKHPDKIIYLKNETNVGMAAGYNKAMEIVKGELVCLIDSDDFWFQDKLRIVDDYFKLHTNCVMHQHPLQIYNFSEPTNEYYRPYLYGGDMMAYIRETKKIPLYVATTGLTFKAEYVRKVLPIPLSFAKNGEAFLTRTVICYGDTGLTYIPLGGYRRTDTNIVFGNASWDSNHYVENILKPSLNTFYKNNNFDLYFAPAVQKPKPKPGLARRIYNLLKK